MKKITIFLTLIIGITIFIGCSRTAFYHSHTSQESNNQDNQNQAMPHNNIINCHENYNCLYQQSLNKKTAKVTITDEVQSLSVIEKSEIKTEPVDNKFKVTMKIIDFKKENENKIKTKSIIGSIYRTCPQIINNLNKIKSIKAICFVPTAQEVKQLAINGLTEDSIKKYNCNGKLIDTIKTICTTSNNSHFPPGIKKPIIYLYPIKKSKINVKINVSGYITKAKPNYLTGWNLDVEPNGKINNKYDYLFYEAQLTNLKLPSEGWIVKYSNLSNWFDKILPLLGLNYKETTQFKKYWLKKLNQADYYEIKLLQNQFLKNNINLIINPKPDTVIRLDFYFKPLFNKIKLKKSKIKTPQRKGFTVVEWGGILDN